MGADAAGRSGLWTTFAALAYSIAVSVGIFVFWSYMLRLLPAVRSAASRVGLLLTMALGSVAIVAMSSWLNAAALAGTAAVETHMAATVQTYQTSLERAHANAVAGQALSRDVARVRQSFADLSEQEAGGTLSGFSGRGAVFRVLTQKGAELQALEDQLLAAEAPIEETFAQGNTILSRMRGTSVEPGPLEDRTVRFSEDAVQLAGLITQLRQLNPAPLVGRAAQDLADAVVLPELDGSTEATRAGQSSTITSVLSLVEQRATTLAQAATEVMSPAAGGRGPLYAHVGRGRGHRLCRQLRSRMGGRHRHRPAARGAGLHHHGRAGRDPIRPRRGAQRRTHDGRRAACGACGL